MIVVSHAEEDGAPFSGHRTADLVVDRVYLGGPQPHWGADPLQYLLGVGLQGGIRARGGLANTRLVALRTSGTDPDWPDVLDLSTGTVTYYGDNRRPGADLHQTPRHGNLILRRTFDLAHGDAEARKSVPPYFFFEKAGPGREVLFRGVLAPGAPDLTADEDLVAVWRSQAGSRFQNYRAKFTVLDIAMATRNWIDDISSGNPLSANCPEPWRRWVAGRHYEALTAARIEYRSKEEQLPRDSDGLLILNRIYAHFRGRPYRLEQFAAHVWQMADGHVGTYEVTRASVDGGRDAIGEYRIGPASDPVKVTFALEAKLYDPVGGGLGVKEVGRLISRLRHRQFGVVVTTSFVGRQAYQEIRADQHPVVILAGADLVDVLREKGYSTPDQVTRWLSEAFPTD
jgi:Restriction endonuclease AspBHI N-terminal/Restriction endonuclease